MPAQVFITKAQIAEMYRLDEDVIVLEGPLYPGAEPVEEVPQGNTLEVWVMDTDSLGSDTHRSVVLDPSGDVLGDERLED